MENPIEEVCQQIISECVMRVMESLRGTLDGPPDSYVLTGSEIEALRKGNMDPLLKEACAVSIYYFLRMLEGEFGAIRVGEDIYEYRLLLERRDTSEAITLIPPEKHEEIGLVFLGLMEDFKAKENAKSPPVLGGSGD